MSVENFEHFFRTARGDGQNPFDYQTRLACGEDRGGRAGASLLIDVPTGCGKTAAVVLAWLWNRVVLRREDWPRRLVYCLPMRTLVEQTRDAAGRWLENLQKAGLIGQVDLHVLMGGMGKDARKEWDLFPGRDAMLIGTQDMLLSRALNRGYGLSRYRWPMHFGLLNNDSLWVFDETQLMGVGVETSAQLDGFRHAAHLGAPTRAFTWWMSATLDDAQLATVDHPRPPDGWPTLRLEAPDRQPGSPVQKRRAAIKHLAAAAPAGPSPADKDYAKKLAALIHEKHQPGTLTLVVLNRVARAREIYQALQKLRVPERRLALVHSRFRPGDRRRHEEVLFTEETDRIVVATQAVEAGVDVSARVLVTELAPWPSLVQRFGRCNRYGEWPEGADVFWVDVRPKDEKDDLRFPYALDDLTTARKLLTSLSEAGPQALSAVSYQAPHVVRSVIRRKDLLDLFDTTADLLGQDLDISRYVRDGDDTDTQVFWRDLSSADALPLEGQPAPARNELCRVTMADLSKFLKKGTAYVWDGLERKSWVETKRLQPGQTYLLPADRGGYDDLLGWTGEPVAKGGHLTPRPPPRGKPPSPYDGNGPSFLRHWLSLADHTRDVVAELDEILRDTLTLTETERGALREAALWHDIGKAHGVFQKLLRDAVDPARPAEACPGGEMLWAKSAGTKRFVAPDRNGFRHELASALAWLKYAPPAATHRDLTAFLIAAHHGRVRLSIRALPDEAPCPDDPDQLHARGVWDRDPLPDAPFSEIALDGLTLDRLELDLGYMQMGDDEKRGPSWLARMLSLRDSPPALPVFGPFRLAYLETLLRAADQRASAREETQP